MAQREKRVEWVGALLGRERVVRDHGDPSPRQHARGKGVDVWQGICMPIAEH
jgi:hypothetical protein